jgi:hypothetical protein
MSGAKPGVRRPTPRAKRRARGGAGDDMPRLDSGPQFARCLALGKRRGVLLSVVALPAVAMCLIAADCARAGTYVMRNCDVPGYPNNLLGPWEKPVDVFPGLEAEDSCATGGGVRFVVGGPFTGGNSTGIVLRPRTQGPQSQIKIVKAVLWYAARLAGTGQPMFFKSQQRFADGTMEDSTLGSPPGSEHVVIEQLIRPDFTDYLLWFQCGPGGVTSPEPCVPANPVPLQIRGMEVTLSEDIPPFLSAPTGSLLSPGPQSGVSAVNYVASDPQAGLSRVDALLDGTVVASQDLSSRCGLSDLTVCPASDNGTLQVDTRSVSNGTVSVGREDALNLAVSAICGAAMQLATIKLSRPRTRSKS